MRPVFRSESGSYFSGGCRVRVCANRKPVGYDDVVGREVVDRRAAQAVQRLADALAQDLKHIADPALAAGCHPPQIGAADHHGTSAESEGLDDVAAAADAAIQEYLNLAADGVGDTRKAADRGGGGVEVVAAVVGHRD